MSGSAVYHVSVEGFTNLDMSWIEQAHIRLGSSTGSPAYTSEAKLNGTVSSRSGVLATVSDTDAKYAFDRTSFVYHQDVSSGETHYYRGTHIGEVRAGGVPHPKTTSSQHTEAYDRWTCGRLMGPMVWPTGGLN